MPESPHVVIVDDDRATGSLLSEYLEKNGYRGTAVTNGADLDRVLTMRRVDLVLLDLTLPGEDGLSICRRLVAEGRAPIIMLTARDSEIDRIVGLELGADDYVGKPFHPRELLARIRNVLRRRGCTAAGVANARRYIFAGWTLDALARRLTGPDGEARSLSDSECEVLLALATNRNRVLSRDRIAELISRRMRGHERNVDVCVSRIRRILGEDAREPRIVKTFYGRGYALGVPVECA